MDVFAQLLLILAAAANGAIGAVGVLVGHQRVVQLFVADGRPRALHGLRAAINVAVGAIATLLDSGEHIGHEDDRDDCPDELEDAANEQQPIGAPEASVEWSIRWSERSVVSAAALAHGTHCKDTTERADRAGPAHRATHEADDRKDGAAQGGVARHSGYEGEGMVRRGRGGSHKIQHAAGAVLTRQMKHLLSERIGRTKYLEWDGDARAEECAARR